MEEDQTNEATDRDIVNRDKEAWVLARIKTTIRLAIQINKIGNCGADDEIKSQALDGLAHGAAVSIIQTVGLEPEYTNLRKTEMRL